MNPRTWIILGASSIIAKEFAHIAASHKHSLLLVGRNQEVLQLEAQDLKIRFKINCEILVLDFSNDPKPLLERMARSSDEIDLFIGHSNQSENDSLDHKTIEELIKTNVTTTCQIIHAYLARHQTQYHVLFLSSMAAVRGRSKNSLYGASKAGIEIYLEGLKQTHSNFFITCARLGFIDTHHTFGKPGIILPGDPKRCAQACWKAVQAGKQVIYFPKLWLGVYLLLRSMPKFLYNKRAF